MRNKPTQNEIIVKKIQADLYSSITKNSYGNARLMADIFVSRTAQGDAVSVKIMFQVFQDTNRSNGQLANISVDLSLRQVNESVQYIYDRLQKFFQFSRYAGEDQVDDIDYQIQKQIGRNIINASFSLKSSAEAQAQDSCEQDGSAQVSNVSIHSKIEMQYVDKSFIPLDAYMAKFALYKLEQV